MTAVGATVEYSNQGAGFSGGGFSNRYGIPAYQAAAVAAFKKQAKIAPQYYNNTGAGFPDVAAVALQFWTIVGGIPDEIGGTSAATPTVAGIVSLLNDARAAAGKRGPLGLVNQLFYAHPEAFTDVTTGSNIGGGGCGIGGFTATKGWDPVTGMGTPLFQKLLKLALSLP